SFSLTFLWPYHCAPVNFLRDEGRHNESIILVEFSVYNMKILPPSKRENSDKRPCIPTQNPGWTLDSIKHSFVVRCHIRLVADNVSPPFVSETNRHSIH